MAKIGYPFPTPGEDERVALATVREMRISPKYAAEICREIRKKPLKKAKAFLEGVIAQEIPLPLKRYKKGVAHRRGLKGTPAGRYPKKTAAHILRLLESAEANAEYKGLDTEKLYIRVIASHRGRIRRRVIPRAFGRASPFNTPTTSVQVLLEER
jgi:large subunit ribosomal protein L22